MDVDAIVLRESGEPLTRERLTLGSPAPDELLVKLVATGICHTDLTVCLGHFPMPLPMVLGHEGAGIVHAKGAEVTGFDVGDHVLLSYSTCGHCHRCRSNDKTYCENFPRLNFGGRRMDGSATLHDGEQPVNGAFFGQSSFASHALVRMHDAVKISDDLPLEILAPLGCGLQTGAGTVLNVLKPVASDVIVVVGAGAVGLAAVMAAKYLGVERIVAVDRIASRLELARSLGATDIVDTTQCDLGNILKQIGDVGGIVETTGVPSLIAVAIAALRPRGICALLGMSGDPNLNLDIRNILGGRTIVGVREGDSDPQIMIPKLIDMYRSGHFPIDRLISRYPFEDFERAITDMKSGEVIKPVLVMS